MSVYIVVFLLAVVIANVTERAWKASGRQILPRPVSLGMLAVVLLLGGVSSLRLGVGTDYWTYEALFPEYAEEFRYDFQFSSEPGLKFIAWIAMHLSGEASTMFAIAAFLTVYLMIQTLWKWSTSFSLSVAFFIVTGAWHGSFNGVRQYIAAAILFAGHRYIIERSYIKWFAVVLIAFLFHTSALIGIVFYFIPIKRTSPRIQFFILALGIMALIGMDSALNFLEELGGDASRWTGSYAERAVNPLRIAFNFLPVFLFWFLKVRGRLESKTDAFYINMLVVYAASFIASFDSALVARFAIYSQPFLSLGLVLATNVENGRERSLLRLCVIGLYALFMFIEIMGTDNLREFNWIFERN